MSVIRNLFLDDERYPNDVFWNGDVYKNNEWCIVRNFLEFQNWILENGMPDILSYDNDLGGELEGYDCAKWLCETYCVDNNIRLNKIYVHSKNISTNQKILDYCAWFDKNFDKFF